MKLHSCACSACQVADSNPTKQAHTLMNFFLAQLDDRQQRLYAGLEARKRGRGSERTLALILGWDEQAIVVARRELELQAGVEEAGDAKTADGSMAEPVPIIKVIDPLPAFRNFGKSVFGFGSQSNHKG